MLHVWTGSQGSPASRRRRRVADTSSGRSPQPSMMEVLVTRAPARLAACRVAMLCSQLARLSLTTPCSRGTCSWRVQSGLSWKAVVPVSKCAVCGAWHTIHCMHVLAACSQLA